MLESAPRPVREVLDLGSGGGNVAVHLKRHARLTLVDISESMLAVSRRLNPECEHRQGDMRTIRLGVSFDAVLVHDAVDYMTSRERPPSGHRDRVRALSARRPGSVRARPHRRVVPRGQRRRGRQDPSGRQASFQEWTWDPDPGDSWVQAEYEFSLRSADGTVQTVHETHRLAAFPRADWTRLLTAAGFVLDPGLADVAAGRRPENVFIARLPG